MNNTTRLVALQLIKTAQAWDPAVQARQAQAKQQAQQAKDTQARAKATATGGKLYKDMTPAEKAQADAEYKAQRRARAQASGGHNAPAGDPGIDSNDPSIFDTNGWEVLKETGNNLWNEAKLAGNTGARVVLGAGSALAEIPGAVAGSVGAGAIGGFRGLYRALVDGDPNKGFWSNLGSGFTDTYSDINNAVNNFDIGGYSIQRGINAMDDWDRGLGNHFTSTLNDMTQSADPSEWGRLARLAAWTNDQANNVGRISTLFIPGLGAAGAVSKGAKAATLAGRIGRVAAKGGKFAVGWGKSEPGALAAVDMFKHNMNTGFSSDATRVMEDWKDYKRNSSDRMTDIYDYLPQQPQQPQQLQQQPQQQPQQQTRQPAIQTQVSSNYPRYNTHARYGLSSVYA